MGRVVGPRNQAGSAVGRKSDRSLSSILYSPDPDPFLAYLDVQRKLSLALAPAQKYRDRTNFIADCEDIEIYSRPVRGLSLSNIEQKALPLGSKQINQISRMLRIQAFPRLSSYEKLAQCAIWMLPTQALARTQFLDKGKNRPIPTQLKPLSDRATAYLDYYLPFLTAPFADSDAMNDFYRHIQWIGLEFWTSFGHYLPARLGLSPVSTIKVFENKFNEMSIPLGVGKLLLKMVEKETQDAYRPDALPSHLHQYLQYDRCKDQEAGTTLQAYCSDVCPAPDDLSVSSDLIFDRLTLYRRALLKDIKTAGKDFRVRLPDHPAIGEIILTSQYPQTLMVVLLLRRNNLHVTLEVNGSGRIYGLPGNLAAESPHAVDPLGRDIFGVILDQAKRRHPEVEPEMRIIIQESFQTRIQASAAALPADMLETEEQTRELKLEKRKATGRLGLIPSFMQSQPALPKPPEAKPARFKVHHTKTEIATHLGKKVPATVIDHVMRSISQFEHGAKKVTPLQKDTSLYRLRVGDYRVILRRVPDGSFYIDLVANRRIVYDD